MAEPPLCMREVLGSIPGSTVLFCLPDFGVTAPYLIYSASFDGVT